MNPLLPLQAHGREPLSASPAWRSASLISLTSRECPSQGPLVSTCPMAVDEMRESEPPCLVASASYAGTPLASGMFLLSPLLSFPLRVHFLNPHHCSIAWERISHAASQATLRLPGSAWLHLGLGQRPLNEPSGDLLPLMLTRGWFTSSLLSIFRNQISLERRLEDQAA